MPYQFTNDWFVGHKPVWKELFRREQPAKVLEIGSFEGQSSVFIIESIANRKDAALYCVDPWVPYNDLPAHDQAKMSSTKALFDKNTSAALARTGNKVSLHVLHGRSDQHLVTLLATGHKGTFDLIYIDGGHEASDVLIDMSLAYLLCRVGGVIICDDYLWMASKEKNPLQEPKIAIDAFVNIFRQQLNVWGGAPLYQLYLTKMA